MEQKVLELIEQGITDFEDIQHYSSISKRKLANLLENLTDSGLLYHPKNTKYYGFIKTGTLIVKSAGYGFIHVEGEESDYFVKEEFLSNLYDGDKVSFYPYDCGHRLLNAAIIQVLERSHEFIIGVFKRKIKKNKNKAYIYSNNPKFPVHAIVKKEIPGVEEGMIVYGKLSYVGTAIEAEVLEIIGHKDDPGIEISQIALEYGFQTEFPPEVYDEIHDIPDEVVEKEIQGRRDFRNQLIITIDGKDSKDFDDAIDIEKTLDGNYKLGVYIADVAHYVKESSPLDQEALKRGTSVYLADRVIPMLPHKLSNGICSLNEGVDRLVLACIMTISPTGNLIDYDICEGVIASKHRMTYPMVNSILKGEEDALKKYPDLIESLALMKELSSILRRKRMKKGALEFNVAEYKFKLDQKGKPIVVEPIIRDDAEKLIEDFMLLANETVAYHLNIMNYPCIYRIHEKPDQEKLTQTLDQLSVFGFELDSKKKKISSLQIQKLINKMDVAPHAEIYHQLLLRSMMKARYSESCIGHYGLAMEYYCHFTSPIRRYPDLLVHRILKDLLLHPTPHLENQLKHYTTILPEIATRTSASERKSIECEREVSDMLFAWYMEDHLEKQFSGVVTSLTSFGIFVTLDNGVEGLVSLESMNGYYEYIEEKHYYTNGKISYHLGDEVEVVVIGADRHEKTVDFMFLTDYNYEEV